MVSRFQYQQTRVQRGKDWKIHCGHRAPGAVKLTQGNSQGLAMEGALDFRQFDRGDPRYIAPARFGEGAYQ